MARIIHVGLSVRGALRQCLWRKGVEGSLVGTVYESDTGRIMTDEQEIFGLLCDLLVQGREMLPLDLTCDNWDWKEGCKGHDKNEQSEAGDMVQAVPAL